MFFDLHVNIKNIGPIDNAELILSKNINIVGGKNGSGKSSLSKILYCFLTANSNENKKIAKNSIYNQIKILYARVGLYITNSNSNFEKLYNDFYSLKNGDINDILSNYNSLKKLLKILIYQFLNWTII